MCRSTDPAAATAGESLSAGAAALRAANRRRSDAEKRPVVSTYRATARDVANSAVEKRPGFAPNSVRATTEFRELMEEPPGGLNAGRAASTDPNVEGRHVALDVDTIHALDYVRGGGWSIVDTRHKPGDAGMTSHRGVTRGDEYVNDDAVLAVVEELLGFTADDVHAAFRQGRVSAERGELRAKIDARLLALSRSGANMTLLARTLGLAVDDESGCQTFKRALRRAKAAELPNEGSK